MKTFLIILLLAAFIRAEDFYSILGVRKTSSPDEIKKAYKKLAKKFHPDLNKDRPDWAKKEFIKVSRAFEVLSDPEKKKMYDMGGEEAVKNAEQGRQGGAGGGANFANFEFDDIIKMFFGGGGGGGRGGQQGGNFQFNFGPGGQQRGGGRQKGGFQGGGFPGGGFPGGGFPGGGHGGPGGPGGPGEQRQVVDFSKEPSIILLETSTAPNFAELTENWNIFMYNEKSQASQEATWVEDFAKKYGAHLKVAVVNCTKQKKICDDLKPKKLPELQIRASRNRSVTIDLPPGLTKEFLVSQNIDMMDKHVQRVSSDNYENFVKENYGKPIILVFTERKSPSILILSIANMLHERIVFAEISKEDKLTKKFAVSSFPTIVLLETPSEFKGKTLQKEPKRENILDFIRTNILNQANYKATKTLTDLTKKMIDLGTCSEKDNNFCLISVIPKGKDRSEQTKVLESLLDRYSKDPISFFFVEENTLNGSSWKSAVEGNKVLIFRGKRAKYLGLPNDIQSYGAKHIEQILDGLLGGNTTQMKPLRTIVTLFK